MNRNIDPFLKALLLLIIFSCFAVIASLKHNGQDLARISKVKSKLKQIGTTVAMYYTDTHDLKYPKKPSLLDIDTSLTNTEQTENWFELSLNSPYIFFPYEGDGYTGSAEKPLAMNWEPFPLKPNFVVVWEDGHVSPVTPEEAEKLKNSTLKNKLTSLLYQFQFRNNQALQ